MAEAGVEVETNWTREGAVAIVAEPYSSEKVVSWLQDLLDEKTMLGVPGRSKEGKAKYILEGMLPVCPRSPRSLVPQRVSGTIYFQTEKYLLNEAWDVYPKEKADKDNDIFVGFRHRSESAMRAYTHWVMATPRFLGMLLIIAGLGLGDADANSDSMRIGSCTQLLGAVQRLKLRIHGGGDSDTKMSGFAGYIFGSQD